MKDRQLFRVKVIEILKKFEQMAFSRPSECADEILSAIEERKPDINTPFFGNSGVKIPMTEKSVYDEAYLAECIEKAEPNLSKITDVDKELAEIRAEKPAKGAEEIRAWFKTYISLITLGNDDEGNDVLMTADENIINEILDLFDKAMEQYGNLKFIEGTEGMDSIISELKKEFSGDASYLSGINDGMYHLYRKLIEWNQKN
jgi:hypothetical protein